MKTICDLLLIKREIYVFEELNVFLKHYVKYSKELIIQWKPLNVITLGQGESYNICPMMAINVEAA